MNGNSNSVPNSSKDFPWVVFVSGPTASGKSSIAKYLASQLGARFIEGDDVRIHHALIIPACFYSQGSQFHPKANINKMQRGEPLNDSDRQGWLEALSEHASVDPDEAGSRHIIVTCSALKREYRDTLRECCRHRGDLRIHNLFLDAPESVLQERAERRKGHFVDPHLVGSQFEILERPGIDEKDTMVLSVVPSLEAVQRDALDLVSEMLQRECQ